MFALTLAILGGLTMTAHATNNKHHRTIQADQGALRFCAHHPQARAFCTFRRLETLQLRLHQNARRLQAHRQAQFWPTLNRDFETSVRVIAHMLNLDRIAPWLLNCADSEGGRGQWVPNRHGSGAGGWLQFLSGTFYSNAPAAWQYASRRGVHVPRRYMSWYSPVGQALTGLSMFATQGSGQWSGAGC